MSPMFIGWLLGVVSVVVAIFVGWLVLMMLAMSGKFNILR